MGKPVGTINSNDFVPCGCTAPRITALFSLLRTGLHTESDAVETSLRAVGMKLIAFSESSRAGNTPVP